LKVQFVFENFSVQQMVMLFYEQCETKGIVFDPMLDKESPKVTLKTPPMPCADAGALLTDVLDSSSMMIRRSAAYDTVTKREERDSREGWKEFIYEPRFRDPIELSQLTMILVRKGSYAHQRRGSQVQLAESSSSVPETGGNGASIVGKPIDKLVFFGPKNEADIVADLLTRLDVPVPQIALSAGIYEFQSGNSIGSAVTAAIKLFDSKLGVTFGGGGQHGSSLKLSLPNLDAALSVLDTDSRFKYVARPKVLIKDGAEVNFTSGQDVRVLGQVVTNGTGQATQSITTVTAGVTLQATPRIRGNIVEIKLHQLVSDFAPSPNSDVSVVRRDLTSHLVMQPGYVYIVGGLQTNRNTQSRRSFFGLPIGSASDAADTEVLLLLTVTPVDS
jgi:type II secretory pathway component GspD/PulD (secretin)